MLMLPLLYIVAPTAVPTMLDVMTRLESTELLVTWQVCSVL